MQKTKQELESEALEWLIAYHKKRKRCRKFYHRIQCRYGYVSGVPYLYTNFVELAFVFSSAKDANLFAGKFSALLPDARVHGSIIGK